MAKLVSTLLAALSLTASAAYPQSEGPVALRLRLATFDLLGDRPVVPPVLAAPADARLFIAQFLVRDPSQVPACPLRDFVRTNPFILESNVTQVPFGRSVVRFELQSVLQQPIAVFSQTVDFAVQSLLDELIGGRGPFGGGGTS